MSVVQRSLHRFLLVAGLLAHGAEGGLVDCVDPMIGTVGTGHVFPGPCRPFGMVQPSPDTGNGSWKYCSGYSGEDRVIRRFSQTHLNGTGQAGLGDIGLLPFVGGTLPDVGIKVPGTCGRVRVVGFGAAVW